MVVSTTMSGLFLFTYGCPVYNVNSIYFIYGCPQTHIELSTFVLDIMSTLSRFIYGCHIYHVRSIYIYIWLSWSYVNSIYIFIYGCPQFSIKAFLLWQRQLFFFIDSKQPAISFQRNQQQVWLCLEEQSTEVSQGSVFFFQGRISFSTEPVFQLFIRSRKKPVSNL